MGSREGRVVGRGAGWRARVRRGAGVALCTLAALAVDRCVVATAPRSGGNVTIVLAVSGGFAGVDWQVTIDGPEGRIVGDRCRGGIACDWEPDELLVAVGDADVKDLADRFFDSEFFEGDSDYGTECCDQFEYTLSYRDSNDSRTVTGSDGTLPRSIRDLIADVTAFIEERRRTG